MEPTSVQKQPPEMLCKKGALRNFAKFKGKHLCQSLYDVKNSLGRSSRSQMFFQIDVLKDFSIITGTHLCQL